MAIQGHSYEEITDDLKERFLDLVANGYTRPEAATALGASARQLRACCNPNSHRYDDKFAKEYARLTEKDGEHHAAYVERLRAATLERALRSSDRMLEKLNIIHDPDWAVHKPQAMQINFKVDEMQAVFAELSDETLERMVAELKQKEQAQLEPGLPIIDVDPS